MGVLACSLSVCLCVCTRSVLVLHVLVSTCDWSGMSVEQLVLFQ